MQYNKQRLTNNDESGPCHRRLKKKMEVNSRYCYYYYLYIFEGIWAEFYSSNTVCSQKLT